MESKQPSETSESKSEPAGLQIRKGKKMKQASSEVPPGQSESIVHKQPKKIVPLFGWHDRDTILFPPKTSVIIGATKQMRGRTTSG